MKDGNTVKPTSIKIVPPVKPSVPLNTNQNNGGKPGPPKSQV
jgi:hypothetical protein